MAIFATKYDKALDSVLGHSNEIRTASMVLGIVGIVVGTVATLITNDEMSKLRAKTESAQ